MTRNSSHFRILPLMLLLCVTTAGAESPPPDGITVGRWILQPYWASNIEYDDNIFRNCDPDDPDCERGSLWAIESDTIHSLLFGLGADMPVRNGMFEFDYTGNQRKYNSTGDRIGRNLEHDLNAKLAMRFGSGDRLTISDNYTLGVTDLQYIDETFGLVFRGAPYNYNNWSVELSREVPRVQGYQIKVSRVDMTFDEGEDSPFNDYRGFQSVFQYRHPIPVDSWLIGHYEYRLIDNYTPNDKIPGENDIEAGPNVLFRTENSKSYQVGFGGFLRQKHPFLMRAGWGRFHYTGLEPPESSFEGLVGHARMQFDIGGRTELKLSMDRRPLPSNYQSYYINNALRVEIERSWMQYSGVGFRLNVSRNKYGDPGLGICDPDVVRVDDRWMLDGYVHWMIHRLVGLRLAATHWQRASNCEASDYKANVISAGITLGWY
jgi:hypothetical protein